MTSAPTSTMFPRRSGASHRSEPLLNSAEGAIYTDHDDISKLQLHHRRIERYQLVTVVMVSCLVIINTILLFMLFVRTQTLDDTAELAKQDLQLAKEYLVEIRQTGVMAELAATVLMWTNATRPTIVEVTGFVNAVVTEFQNNQTIAVLQAAATRIAGTADIADALVTRLATVFQVPQFLPTPTP